MVTPRGSEKCPVSMDWTRNVSEHRTENTAEGSKQLSFEESLWNFEEIGEVTSLDGGMRHEKTLKNLKKLSKNLLTNQGVCGIIYGLS